MPSVAVQSVPHSVRRHAGVRSLRYVGSAAAPGQSALGASRGDPAGAPCRLIALVTVLLLIAGAVPIRADGTPLPKLVIDAPVAHLGAPVRGEVLELAFDLRNAGDAPLRILSAQPG